MHNNFLSLFKFVSYKTVHVTVYYNLFLKIYKLTDEKFACAQNDSVTD